MIHKRIPSLRATATRAFPKPFMHELAAIETFQLGVAACGVSAGLIPKKAQQRITLPLERSCGM